MSYFDINILSPFLDNNNIESTSENCYLFLMFFLQRSQLISNIISIINKKQNLALGIKFLIMNESKFTNINRKMKDFRKEFEKTELITEILDFIKKTMDNPLLGKKTEDTDLLVPKVDTKPLFFKSRLQTLLSDFYSIEQTMHSIDNSLVLDDNDISNFINGDDKIHIRNDCKKRLEKEIINIELQWIKYKKNPKKNKELYSLLKNWYNL